MTATKNVGGVHDVSTLINFKSGMVRGGHPIWGKTEFAIVAEVAKIKWSWMGDDGSDVVVAVRRKNIFTRDGSWVHCPSPRSTMQPVTDATLVTSGYLLVPVNLDGRTMEFFNGLLNKCNSLDVRVHCYGVGYTMTTRTGREDYYEPTRVAFEQHVGY